MKLHQFDRRQLAEAGKAVLWRPVAQSPCPFGKPGDIIATDCGLLRVTAVEARRLEALLSETVAWAWRVEVEVVVGE